MGWYYLKVITCVLYPNLNPIWWNIRVWKSLKLQLMYLSDLFIPSAERAATAGVCRDGRSQRGSQTPSVCYTGMLTYYLQPHSTWVSECLWVPHWYVYGGLGAILVASLTTSFSRTVCLVYSEKWLLWLCLLVTQLGCSALLWYRVRVCEGSCTELNCLSSLDWCLWVVFVVGGSDSWALEHFLIILVTQGCTQTTIPPTRNLKGSYIEW